MSIDDDALGALLDELDIGLELNSAGPAIAPLIDLLIGGASQAPLHVAAADAVEALWDAGLEQEIRTELEELQRQVEGEDTQPVSTIDCALAELGAREATRRTRPQVGGACGHTTATTVPVPGWPGSAA